MIGKRLQPEADRLNYLDTVEVTGSVPVAPT